MLLCSAHPLPDAAVVAVKVFLMVRNLFSTTGGRNCKEQCFSGTRLVLGLFIGLPLAIWFGALGLLAILLKVSRPGARL